MAILKQGTSYTRLYKLVASSDHTSLISGVDSRVRLSKAGGAFVVSGGTTNSVGFGWYRVFLTSTDCNTLGDLAFYVTGTSADDTDFVDQIVARVSDDLAFPTTKGNSIDVNATGEVGIDWGNIGNPATTQNLSSTNIDVDQIVASVSGAVGSVTGSVGSVTTPVFTQGGTIGSITGSIASVVTVTGNVNGSVNSVTIPVFVQGGTIGKVTGTVAVLTSNSDKTGYSLVDPQTFSLTGNITGNISGSVGSVTGAVGSVSGSVGSVVTPVFVQGGTVGTITGTISSVGSVTGSVNSVVVPVFVQGGTVGKVTGTVGSVTGAVGSVTGNVGGDVVGNVQGNVTGSVGSVSGAVNSVTVPVFTQGGTIGKVLGSVTVASGQLFVKKNTNLSAFMFPMVDSADHVTLKTGLTVAGTVAIDGGAFGSLTNSVSELGSGVYKVDLAAADVNGTNIMLKFTAVGGDTRLIEIITQA